ncbi:HEAT repeat domain-containing protein [Nostoc sp. FACHB-190]|uniref:HEAT repeat domain-containing protein n=1 Tax=Nostoc sp. FACHB-190 TaxID=2692838 RepID=UPI0016858F74|nr:HEAT repeat domain-containing protein [Nostoc sp. FACHB-190]MBD2300271.1 HEAT repeat domain-containing protein [Nostoc sp. FACHB-190]
MLETKIINYLSHLGDSDYMAEVATSPDAIETLIKMLQNHDPDVVGYAGLFITDFVLSCSRNETCKISWETQLEPVIIPELERLVFAENHFIRRQVIYTLGKICSYESVPVLLQAFYEYRESDPILLPRLLGELFWLGVENRSDILASMVNSQYYTTRWAVINLLGEFMYNSASEQDATFSMKYNFSDKLRNDSHPLVQAEAEYEYQLLVLQNRKMQENMSKSDYKKQRKDLKKLEPYFCFSDVVNLFSYYMSTNNLFTYTIQELETFIDNKIQQL